MDLLQVGDQQESSKVALVYDVNYFVGRIAVAGSDYEGRSNVLLTFNAATRSIAVPVNLTDDSVYEGEEDFGGTLSLVSDPPRVTINPDNAVAAIEDNEGIKTTFTDKKQISCL